MQSLDSPLHDVADALTTSPSSKSLQAQKERVAAARAQFKNLNDGDRDGGKSSRLVAAITDNHTNGLVGHRLVTPAQQAKYPQAVWEPKAASFHDREALVDISNRNKAEKHKLSKEIAALEQRLKESAEAVARLNEKKRHLSNMKNMKDFKVDLGLKNVENADAGRDGWLNVPPPPLNDPVARQLHSLEVKLLNKEMLKGMAAVEAFAEKAKAECADAAARLERRKEKLAQFPVKAIQNVEEVQRASIALVDVKADLEAERDDMKRLCAKKVAAAKAELMKMRDLVQDESEALGELREDFKYWTTRLKLERVKIEPVQESVEAMKRDLDARSSAMISPRGGPVLNGWQALVVKAAFVQGCNMDLLASGNTSPRLRSQTSGNVKATKYNELVDKIFARRIPEVCHAHIYPSLNLVTEDAVRRAAEKVGAWFDTEEFGESKFSVDDFYRIVGVLREFQEAGEFDIK